MGDHIDRLSDKVGLARTRVGRYLRKGESGKIEDVEAYVRYMKDRYGGIPPGAMSPKQFEKEQAKKREPGTPGQLPKDFESRMRQAAAKQKLGIGRKVPTADEKARGKGEFLGHDANGNEIKQGSPVLVTAGPDKGLRGTVRGVAKGGGVRVEVAGNLGKTREVLVDPDELRVKSR
jgi:hypothetical protein